MLKIELYETLLVNKGVAFFPDIVKMAVELGISSRYMRTLLKQIIDNKYIGGKQIPELNLNYGFLPNTYVLYLKAPAKSVLKSNKVDSFYKVKPYMEKAMKISKALYERGYRAYPYPIPREKIWIFGRPTREEIIKYFGKEII